MTHRHDRPSVRFEVEGSESVQPEEPIPVGSLPVISGDGWDLVAQLEAEGMDRGEAEAAVRKAKADARAKLRHERRRQKETIDDESLRPPGSAQ